MEETLTKLNKHIHDLRKETIDWRRYLHQYPELSFEEIKTAQFIYDTLISFDNLQVTRPTKTSVMARLITDKPGKILAIRADMDALPIQEENNVSYRSKFDGKMHACGHDGHTSILLATAKILSKMKDHLSGEVRFLFQHGEEKLPGGAQEMIAAGVMKDVDFVLGAHLWSLIEQGKVFTKNGPFMAAADVFTINIKGKGGHSAEPHLTTDTLAIGTQVVNNLQHIIARNVDPFDNAVVSVTKFTAGTSHSIIPDQATIIGSVRTFNQKVREFIPERMRQIVGGLTSAHGATFDIEYQKGYFPVINDEYPTTIVQETIKQVLGEGSLISQNPMMISEDFSAFQTEAPGCFILIGAGNKEKGITFPHHHPKFDIDENALEIGVKIFTNAAFQFLSK